jgi:hypothetical protein
VSLSVLSQNWSSCPKNVHSARIRIWGSDEAANLWFDAS